MSTSEALGAVQEVALNTGRLRYHERGEGPVVVFIHGALVNADLWRKVVPGLAEAGVRCVAPDWPLGSHEVPVPEMDLSPPGLAAVIADFLERLDLHEVTLVANDTGGGLTQVLMATMPDRVARVVLTPSDSFERFFPPLFAYLPVLARVPGGVWLLTRIAGWPLAQRLPFGIAALTKHGVPRDVVRSWTSAGRRDRAIRADLRRFLRQVDRRHTLAAAQALHTFDRPVLLAWATEDRVFPISLAHRLAHRLPQAHIEAIDDSFTFVSEDQPDRLVDLILEFLHAHRAFTSSSATPIPSGAETQAG